MRKNLLLLTTILILGLLAACGSSENENTETPDEDGTYSLKVGVTAGPHEQVMEKVQEVAKDNGLELDITVFTDYAIPNIALDEGDIDVNSFQHGPFLEDFIEERGLDIENIADTIIFPMGIYTNQIDDLDDIQEGDTIGLPNDPTNEAHALIVFEEAGLITLEEDAGLTASVKDIANNPLDLEFIELESAQIPAHLDEVTAAAINTNFAIDHGFTPAEDAIYLESVESPWVNILAARAEDADSPAIEKLIDSYHSDVVKEFIEEEFSGSLIPAW